MDLLDAVQALGGKNKLIEVIKKEMAEGNNTGWWNLINTCSKFVPKEVDASGTIRIVLDLPTAKPELTEPITTIDVIAVDIDDDIEAPLVQE